MKNAVPVKRLFATLIDFLLPMIIYLLLQIFARGLGETVYTLLSIIFFTIIPIYQLYLFTKGQTLGKKLLNMKVVKRENQEEVGFFVMFLRETLGKFLSGAILLLGYIWILIDDNNQGWHDKFMNTVVVQKS